MSMALAFHKHRVDPIESSVFHFKTVLSAVFVAAAATATADTVVQHETRVYFPGADICYQFIRSRQKKTFIPQSRRPNKEIIDKEVWHIRRLKQFRVV